MTQPPPLPPSRAPSQPPAMHDVRILFTASQSWFGRLIRRITRGTVSHCMIEFPCWDRRVIEEATVGGTRIVPSVRARHHVVAEFRCRFPTRRGMEYLLTRLGTEYDYAGLLIVAWWRIALRWFATKANLPSWSTTALKCSELITYFLQACEVEAAGALPAEVTTPEDLLALCARDSARFEVLR